MCIRDSHQDYLVKNPNGYCGLGGTGVKYTMDGSGGQAHPPLDPSTLNAERQLIVFEAETCPYCEKFKQDAVSYTHLDVYKRQPSTWPARAPLTWRWMRRPSPPTGRRCATP